MCRRCMNSNRSWICLPVDRQLWRLSDMKPQSPTDFPFLLTLDWSNTFCKKLIKKRALKCDTVGPLNRWSLEILALNFIPRVILQYPNECIANQFYVFVQQNVIVLLCGAICRFVFGDLLQSIGLNEFTEIVLNVIWEELFNLVWNDFFFVFGCATDSIRYN